MTFFVLNSNEMAIFQYFENICKHEYNIIYIYIGVLVLSRFENLI